MPSEPNRMSVEQLKAFVHDECDQFFLSQFRAYIDIFRADKNISNVVAQLKFARSFIPILLVIVAGVGLWQIQNIDRLKEDANTRLEDFKAHVTQALEDQRREIDTRIASAVSQQIDKGMLATELLLVANTYNMLGRSRDALGSLRAYLDLLGENKAIETKQGFTISRLLSPVQRVTLFAVLLSTLSNIEEMHGKDYLGQELWDKLIADPYFIGEPAFKDRKFAAIIGLTYLKFGRDQTETLSRARSLYRDAATNEEKPKEKLDLLGALLIANLLAGDREDAISVVRSEMKIFKELDKEIGDSVGAREFLAKWEQLAARRFEIKDLPNRYDEALYLAKRRENEEQRAASLLKVQAAEPGFSREVRAGSDRISAEAR
jgi:hypothetical protein